VTRHAAPVAGKPPDQAARELGEEEAGRYEACVIPHLRGCMGNGTMMMGGEGGGADLLV
jgi:hypothetical protein